MATQGNQRLQQDFAADQASGNKDPLAELARLIGQNNGFTNTRQAAQPAAQQAAPEPAAYAPPPAQTRYQQPAHDLRGSYDGGAQSPAVQKSVAPRYATPVAAAPAPAQAQPVQPQQQQYADQHYADEHYAEQHYDPAYDTGYDQEYIPEEPKKKRGLQLVAAAVGLCVIGAAGAYAYRSMGPTISGPPPVIKASDQPNKVAGTPQQREPVSTTTYNRAGNGNQPERMMTREETPMDIKAGTQAAPRTVGSIPAAPAAQSTGMTPPPPAAEPKKVKTERILPNGPVTGPSTGPRSDTTKPAPVRTASIAPVVAATPPSSAAVAAPSPTGGHVVQISSQKSEGDAKSSYKSLQAKYPSVLAGKSPLIRKADLGEKGTVYRVQLGPFASASQATELCTNLKAAGGQCIVQKN